MRGGGRGKSLYFILGIGKPAPFSRVRFIIGFRIRVESGPDLVSMPGNLMNWDIHLLLLSLDIGG